MPKALIGRKVGMTRVFTEDGVNVPVTVIEVGPCFVSQIKSSDGADGYDAVQLAFGEVKPRNSTFPKIGHDAKAGLSPKRIHREVRTTADEAAEFEVGQELTVDEFDNIAFVDITGTSKGKGFAGTMKRHGFKGQPASHGVERKHRSPGSVSGRASYLGGGRPKKGIRMGGHIGAEKVTARSLEIVGRDKKKNLIWVKGSVPGANKGLVFVKESKRLYKSKGRRQAEAKKA